MVSANLGAAAIIKIPWQTLVLVSVIWYSWAGFVLAVCHKGPKTSWNWKSGLGASETTRDEMGFCNCSLLNQELLLKVESAVPLVGRWQILGSNASWKAGFVVLSFLQWWAKVVFFLLDVKVWEASKPQKLPNQAFDQRISEVGRAAFPRPDKNSSLGVE